MRTLGRDINRRLESLTRTLTASLRALPNYHAIFIAMSGWPDGNGPHRVSASERVPGVTIEGDGKGIHRSRTHGHN